MVQALPVAPSAVLPRLAPSPPDVEVRQQVPLRCRKSAKQLQPLMHLIIHAAADEKVWTGRASGYQNSSN